MQKHEGKANSAVILSTKVKEAAAAALLLCLAGTALAWGVSQMASPASQPKSVDEQCRGLGNALLAGDTELVFSYLNKTDAKHLKMDTFKLKAFQEELFAPRLSVPLAWRPMNNRAFSCQGREGIIFIHLDEPIGRSRTSISLPIHNDNGTLSLRYDDLLRILSNLDKASSLTDEQKTLRMTQDAEVMVRTGLDGYSQLHPGKEADLIYANAETQHAANRMPAASLQQAPRLTTRTAEAAAFAPPVQSSRRVRAEISSAPDVR